MDVSAVSLSTEQHLVNKAASATPPKYYWHDKANQKILRRLNLQSKAAPSPSNGISEIAAAIENAKPTGSTSAEEWLDSVIVHGQKRGRISTSIFERQRRRKR